MTPRKRRRRRRRVYGTTASAYSIDNRRGHYSERISRDWKRLFRPTWKSVFEISTFFTWHSNRMYKHIQGWAAYKLKKSKLILSFTIFPHINVNLMYLLIVFFISTDSLNFEFSLPPNVYLPKSNRVRVKRKWYMEYMSRDNFRFHINCWQM